MGKRPNFGITQRDRPMFSRVRTIMSNNSPPNGVDTADDRSTLSRGGRHTLRLSRHNVNARELGH